jgi:hypothetical protein
MPHVETPRGRVTLPQVTRTQYPQVFSQGLPRNDYRPSSLSLSHIIFVLYSLELRHFVSVMPPLLLQSVEEMIGLTDGWPRNILRLLFSSRRTVAHVKTVTCFFYGNGVPVDLAYQIYDACMVTRTGVQNDVKALYNWFKGVDFGWGIHLGKYYDLRRRLYMYINGPKFPKSVLLEPVVPAPHPHFGFGATLCPENEVVLQHVFCGTRFCTHLACRCDCIKCTKTTSLTCQCCIVAYKIGNMLI